MTPAFEDVMYGNIAKFPGQLMDDEDFVEAAAGVGGSTNGSIGPAGDLEVSEIFFSYADAGFVSITTEISRPHHYETHQSTIFTYTP